MDEPAPQLSGPVTAAIRAVRAAIVRLDRIQARWGAGETMQARADRLARDELAGRRAALDARRRRLDERARRIAARDQRLRAARERLTRRAAVLDARRDRLAARDRTLTARAERLTRRTAAARARAGRVAAQRFELRERLRVAAVRQQRGAAATARRRETDRELLGLALAPAVHADAVPIAVVRRMLAGGDRDGVAAALGRLRADVDRHGVAALVGALLALHDDAPAVAWALLGRVEREYALRVVPAEWVRAAALVAPEAVPAAVGELVDRAGDARAGPLAWLQIAQVAFAAGHRDLARRALDCAAPVEPHSWVGERAAWLAAWLDRPVDAPPVAAGTAALAILDCGHPDRDRASINIGDHAQTVGLLTHLARRRDLRLRGDPELLRFVDRLRDLMRPQPDSVVRDRAALDLELRAVDRDSTTAAAVADGTWMIAYGWYLRPRADGRYDLPLHPGLRPVFLSFHLNVSAALTPDAAEQLRRCGPVGCRDWSTVALLRAAGVPAFFSGCVTETVDDLDAGDRSADTLYVDTAQDGPGRRIGQASERIREQTLAENLDAALERVLEFGRAARVVTSRLHCYLPARALGVEVDFRPVRPGDLRFDGLIGATDDELASMRTSLRGKLDTVLDAITSGAAPDEVYAAWRAACAADVAAAGLHFTGACGPAPCPPDEIAELAALARNRIAIRDEDESTGVAVAVVAAAGTAGDVDADMLCCLLPHVLTATRRLVLLRAEPDGDHRIALADLARVDLAGTAFAARTPLRRDLASGFGRMRDVAQRQPDPERAREFVALSHAAHAFDFAAIDDGVLVLDLEVLRAEDFSSCAVAWTRRYGLRFDEALMLHAGPRRAELPPAEG